MTFAQSVKFVNIQVVIGEDSGAVTVLYIRDMEDDTYLFKPIATRNDHDNSVLSISVSTNKTKIVTGGMDMWYVMFFTLFKNYLVLFKSTDLCDRLFNLQNENFVILGNNKA